jgi:hypothetical protein
MAKRRSPLLMAGVTPNGPFGYDGRRLEFDTTVDYTGALDAEFAWAPTSFPVFGGGNSRFGIRIKGWDTHFWPITYQRLYTQ